jgi:precorrin-6B methylase 2
VANQVLLHECAELYDTHDVLHAMCELLAGAPSDDAACGGARALFHLLRYKKNKRLSALAAKDVHDILVPLFLRKTGAAKEAVMQALRVPMADTAWMEGAWPYFQSRGSAPKVYQVVQEMNGLDDLKALATTGKTADKLRQGNQTITQSLEASHRLEMLQPAKVAAFFTADLPPDATVLDVGAGTGILSFAFASALPEGRVLALEVRSDAIRAVRARAARDRVTNVTAMRMAEEAAPELPDGARAHLILLCDVLEMIPEHAREGLAGSLRALLAPGGRLLVICERSQSDNLLVDIQDAGFLQRRVAQMITNRRVMLFEPDPAAAPPLAPQPAPAERPEDALGYVDPAAESEPGSVGATGAGEAGGAAGGGAPVPPTHEVDRTPSRDVEDESDEEAGCMLEDNPVQGGNGGCTLEENSGEDAGGCMLEKNAGQQEGGCTLEENAGDGGGSGEKGGCALEDNDADEGGCMLEENAVGAPHAEEEEEDGCMLEDNDAEGEEDEDCLLEENA